MNNSKSTNNTIKVVSLVAKVCYGLALAGFIAYLTVYMIYTLGVDWIAYATGGLLLVAIVLSAIIQASLLVEKLYDITQNWIFAFGLILSIASIVVRVLLGRQGVSFLLYTFTIAGTSFLYVLRKLFAVKTNTLKVTKLSYGLVFSCIATVLCIVYIVLFLDALLEMFGYVQGKINNVFALLAAALGGGLTLAGVAWTIKSTSNERTEELKYRCCPYMSIVSACYQSNTLNKMADIEIEGSISGTIAKTHTKLFRVRLSKNADCIIKGVLVNGEFRRVKNESISVAESEFNIGVVNMKELITIETFSIVVTDILQNWYKYNCKVVPVDAEDCKEYMIQSIGLPVLMNTNEIKEIK